MGNKIEVENTIKQIKSAIGILPFKLRIPALYNTSYKTEYKLCGGYKDDGLCKAYAPDCRIGRLGLRPCDDLDCVPFHIWIPDLIFGVLYPDKRDADSR